MRILNLSIRMYVLFCSTAYERYLRAALGDVALRHCPALLELLEISVHTFNTAQVRRGVVLDL